MHDPAPRRPYYRSWWFWLLLVLLAAALFALRGGLSERPDAPLFGPETEAPRTP